MADAMSSFDRIVGETYELEVEDRFEGPELDETRWLLWYLPQWSSRERAAARFSLTPEGLELRIDADQQPWCPDLDGPTRVSSLQTGVHAGPLESSFGQHRFHPDAVVREEQEPRALLTPTYGAFAMRARADLDAGSMAALWMIGYEDKPERSAEICVAEIFGRNVTPDGVAIGMGVHPFGDPSIVDDFAEVPVAIDVAHEHEYAAVWAPDGVHFFVDGEPARDVRQRSPDYPMQFMLGIYAFDDPGRPSPPRRFVVRSFRAWRHRG
jgi:hypothetical protein